MATSDFEIDEQVTVRESAEFRHANQELLEALEDRDSRGDCSAESTDEALKPGLRDRDRSSEGRSSGNDSEDHGVRRESRSSFLVPRDSLDDDSPLSNRESNSVPRGSIERQKSIRKPTESNAARNVANDLKNERGGAEERIPKNGKICESRTDRSLGNPEDKADYTRQIAVMDEGEEIEGASTGIQNRTNNVASSCKPVIHKIVSSGKYSSSAEPNTRIGKFEGDSPPRVKSSPPRVSSRNHADPVIDNTSGVYLDRVPRGSQRPAPCKIHDSPKDSFQSPVKKRDGSPGRKTGRSAGRSAAEGAKSLNGGRQGCPRKCENCGESHFSYDRYAYLGKYSGYLERDAGLQEEKEAPKDTRARGAGTPSLYRSRSLPRLSMHDSGVACSGNEQTALPGRAHSSRQLVADLKQLLTLKQHYYPEGGWGWVVLLVGVLVQVLSHGMHGASGVFLQQVATRFGPHVHLESGWLGAMSTGVALLVSPVTIAFCRRKSTRVTAVLGGLVTALGCLFTSFASQFHQLFFSYGTVVGIGVGMTRDCSTLMVAQYFKRRRELVEIFIVSGSGLGIAVMSAFIKGAISKIGWRLGLQAVTGVVFLTFILGTFYRSASLYHPQRRAILHLKNQKRKIKDKNKTDDRPPFFDFSTLKSKTVRILLVSTGISAFGINTPIFYLAHQAEEEGLGDTVVLLQAYLGLAWTLGCVAFGLLVVHRSVECRIARQYLTQAAVFVCGLCILALTAVQGNYHGYVMFAWIYGIFCGGYHYSLKMYTYERVRARNFARTWGFVQCSQAIPIAIGVPISGYMNVGCGGKAGYYFSSTCVLVGSFTLFFIDLHRRNLSRHKHTRSNGTKHLCVSDSCPQRRRLSFSQEPDNEGPHVAAAGAAAAALVLGGDFAPAPAEMIDALGPDKPELTCISEEGIADMDLPDNLLEDLDYIGDCITSCNKVENYLMLSEFENNLIAEMPIIMDRRGRRWSLARSKGGQASCGQATGGQSTAEEEDSKPKWRLTNVPPNANSRVITVIDEAST